MYGTKKESTEMILDEAGLYNLDQDIELVKVATLTKDMKTEIIHCENMSKAEIRSLVSLFYQIQKIRIKLTEQVRSIERGVASPDSSTNPVYVDILNYMIKNVSSFEKNISTCLQLACEADEVGRWLLGIKGIGPVLAAGCLSYFDVEGKEYSSQFISYAGLNDQNRPWLGREKSTNIINEVLDGRKQITDEDVIQISIKTQWPYSYLAGKAYNQDKKKWNKEDLIKACSMIPYNKDLKMLMFKVACSFNYLKNNKDSKYGSLLSDRIAYETLKNERGDYVKEADKKIKNNHLDMSKDANKCYVEGKLPPAHIKMRSYRWVEKIFISHLFEEMYRVRYNKIPPRYYALEHCDGHHDEIEPEVPYSEII